LDPASKVNLPGPRFGAGEVDPIPATGIRICGREVIFDNGAHRGSCLLAEHDETVKHSDGIVRWWLANGVTEWEVVE
jgi:hypothetical protein